VTHTRSNVWPWVGLVVTATILLIATGYAIATPNQGSAFATAVGYLADLAFPLVGALILSRRPGNAVGSCLLGAGFFLALIALTLEFPRYVTITGTPTTLIAALAWVGQSAWAPGLALIAVYTPLLFPEGHVLSRRWRIPAWVAGIGAALVLVANSVVGAVENAPFKGAPPNPLAGVPGADSWGPLFGTVGALGVVLMAPVAFASVVVRFRRAGSDEREQIKWFTYGAAVLVLAIVVGLVFDTLGYQEIRATILGLGVLAIPLSAGIAILRHRLYDIEIVIRKTAIYAVLVALLLLVLGAMAFVATRVLTDLTNGRLQLLAGLVLGALIWPLRRVAVRIADRLVFGGRATPYEVLTAFSGKVGETYSTEDVLPRMVQVLQGGTGATGARVLLAVGSELREAVSTGSPEGTPHRSDVLHQGERLGVLEVTMPANDPMTPAKELLVTDLAAQAGPVLRNVRLIEELRASRQRLVAAQDEERRKIERNLHDGVQQQLVALNVQLGLLAKIADRDPSKTAPMAEELQGRATEALEDLRDLARGIYPPLLADKGLGAALEAQARKAAVPTTVEAGGVSRYDQAVESAVYFCSMEALNNIAKYAQATAATITLAQSDGHLTFTVADDGAGFNADATSYGTGLQGMADRLDAIGGTLHVASEPGSGTTVIGTVPV
jgi:signal transduction histidine kinase